MKRNTICLYMIVAGCLFNSINIVASNEKTNQSLTQSEESSEEVRTVMLIDLLIKPYLEKIEEYNQENKEAFTVEENDKWLFWYANYKKEYEQFDSVLESMSEELEKEVQENVESESETFPQIVYSAPSEFEDDMMQSTLQELLMPYQHGIEVVNDTEKSKFEIPSELSWNFLYYFADMTENEFVDYLTSEYKQIEAEDKKDAEEETKTFLAEIVKDVQTERNKNFLEYQTVIDRVQKEQNVSIMLSDDEKWLAAITLEHFSIDEFYDYLQEQFE